MSWGVLSSIGQETNSATSEFSEARLRATAGALAVALLLLSILDLEVTNLNISRFGAVELNPLMAPLLGTPWATVAKVGIPTVIIVLTLGLNSWRAVRFLRIAVAIYVAVAISGLVQVAYALA